MLYLSDSLVEVLKEEFKGKVRELPNLRGETSLEVEKEVLLTFMGFLKHDDRFKMDMLVDLTVVDYPDRNPRFEVVYHLRSLSLRHNLRVKCWAEGEEVPSVVELWKAADWLEREAYEMFGVKFTGRELRKLLLPQKYPYFPLRKDFPLEGKEAPCDVWDWE
ncbi:NADH:ubiquinone oxidoreductase subunit C [Thermovibrio guaymasensis]|uniref:NADH:ubiquinone oxidoreductase subunit C n=1 Tax=Thermovibrio guaymasensis TaxID=240167 RepID=A0A420W8N2_9BACT|nr:NADH-quinone oxidoreductase subunit C [Thermovibrio guaymasensis]RKQ63681.1 NADH:ubiquinone oxidoreductase subunit C [Thermovibrio guaymasensis]